MDLTYLTNKSLLADTKVLAEQYRRITTKLLHHLKEIERRRLFSDLGYPSLFDYVVKELGFSESSAARRIHAARLLAEVPEIEEKIEDGSLNLTNITMASHIFKNEEIKDTEVKKEIIKQIENTTKKECESRLKQFFENSPPAPNLFILKVELREEGYELLENLKGLLAHRKRNLSEVFEIIFEAAVERLTEKKFKTKASRKTSTGNPRYIKASLKKAVYERDKVCQKCGGKHALEIDHRVPFALGGKTEITNLRLLCRSCNQRARIRAGL